METTRSLYYDVGQLGYGPSQGDFIVSVGKKGIGTLYHISESRQAKNGTRYNLRVYVANDLKPKLRIEIRRCWVRHPRHWQSAPSIPEYRWKWRKLWKITVCGTQAWVMYWYPRTKKK